MNGEGGAVGKRGASGVQDGASSGPRLRERILANVLWDKVRQYAERIPQ